MSWRDKYKVHRVADRFPMMPDDELAELGKDIKANNLTSPITFFVPEHVLGATIEYVKANGVLADGRNRMEAMERAGIELTQCAIETVNINEVDPVAFIIGRNIRRRHLTKLMQAELIVAACKAEHLAKCGEVPKRHIKGKAGSEKDAVKEAAVAAAASLKNPIGKRTVERAMENPEAKKPARRRTRRHPAQIKCDNFVDHFLPVLEGITESTGMNVNDVVIFTLTKKQRADAVETVEKAIAALTALLDELQPG